MPEFYWIAAAAVVVTGSARLTRLLVIDEFPPIAALRNAFEDATDGSKWQRLTMCGYCMSFWATALVVLLGDLAGVFDQKPVAEWMTPAWWLLFGTLGASYLAAILMASDGDDSDEEDGF